MNTQRDHSDKKRQKTSAALVGEIPLEEKAAMTAGIDVWTAPGSNTAQIPPLRMTDGPNGARGSQWDSAGPKALCLPCGSCLGASFDAALLKEVGALLGRETRQKRARMLLAPTINLPRSPLFGRSFECYSEDPHLSGRLAAAFVAGVQSEGVAATPKHLVGNESETTRFTVDSVIDERTLREVYLVPFEWAITKGKALAVMTAYNRLNGRWCSTQSELLNTILRNDWGFSGIVVSDWFGAGSTVESLLAGLDIQMPGTDRYFGQPITKAIKNSETELSKQLTQALDASIQRRMKLHETLGAFEDETQFEELSQEHETDRDLARTAASSGCVLLENNGVLPLAPKIASGQVKKIALIGPNAVHTSIMSGGSAELRAHRRITLQDAFEQYASQNHIELAVEIGTYTNKLLAPVTPDEPFKVSYLPAGALIEKTAEDSPQTDTKDTESTYQRPSNTVLATDVAYEGEMLWAGEAFAGGGLEAFSATLEASLQSKISGEHTFSLIQAGRARLIINGKTLIDGFVENPGPSENFFGLGSQEMRAGVFAEKGELLEIRVETELQAGSFVRAVRIGHQDPIPHDLFERAVQAASDADVAVVCVGTNKDHETEGSDRTGFELFGDQDRLIKAVSQANENTVVVINAGAPVDLQHTNEAAAVVMAWLGGQEAGDAILDVLLGNVDAGGRLPVSWPHAIKHTPSFGSFPNIASQTTYTEGVLSGYKHYQAKDIPTKYCFGYGLSYGQFKWSNPAITQLSQGHFNVEVTVENTSAQTASEVVQCYICPDENDSLLQQGMRAARSFYDAKKLTLKPGETATVSFDVLPRAFARWSPAKLSDRAGTEIMMGAKNFDTTAELIEEISRPAKGWIVDAGEWQIELAKNVEEPVFTMTAPIVEPLGPLENLKARLG